MHRHTHSCTYARTQKHSLIHTYMHTHALTRAHTTLSRSHRTSLWRSRTFGWAMHGSTRCRQVKPCVGVTAINTSPHEQYNLLVRPGTNIHLPCTCNTNATHYTPPHDRTHPHAHRHMDPLMRTRQALTPLSFTVVMVVLELKASLKAFNPVSVTSSSPVCMCQQSM